MKNVLLVIIVILFLATGVVASAPTAANAGGTGDEIAALKALVEEIERKRAAEIQELKSRIEALEKEKQQSTVQNISPPAEVQELKETVGRLQAKVDAQDETFSTVTSFMEKHKLNVGLRLQTWYQFMEDGKKNGTKDLHDFMVRRFYFYIKGEVMPKIGFFAHIAADRIGQDNLDNPGVGLGSGLAVRDAWIYYNMCDAFKVQMGRMYIPFTRNYGTTSTFALLPLELPFNQGGVRGGIFYASKVGRDDGIVLWGNPLNGKLQYRLGISEGVENADNPDDNLRYTGRLSFNFLEPELSWFNKGNYLGEKKVLALGAGFDYQDDLILGGRKDQKNFGWTVDCFFDHPVGGGAVTVEAAYIHVQNVTQTLRYSWLTSGDDAQIYYIQGGYLFPGMIGPGRVQPYFRFERLDVDEKPDTGFPSLGFNYLLKGHNAKLTFDWTLIDQRDEVRNIRGNYSGKDQNLFTFQAAVGF